MAPRKQTLEERFQRWTALDPNTGCLIWKGKIDWGGYGHIKHDGRDRKAATVAYEMVKGLVPKGLVIDHLCRNRACVNADHLEAVTQKVNWERSGARAKFVKQGQQKFACDKCGAAYVQIGVRKSGRQTGQAEYGCRFCRAERARQWREENPNAYRAWFLDNKDHVNQTRRIRRRKHGSF